jgi:16S rRNA (adenine1518-N6/adenine1519-N6)-dimethyltransferase
MRRKTLRQALATWAGSPAKAEEILISAEISPSQRAEELSIDDFIKIARNL